MRQTYILILIIIILNLLLFSCNPSSPTMDTNLYWIEYQGRFYTQDIVRAQEIMPFQILLPKYIPNEGQRMSLPLIDGPLKDSQNFDNTVTVNIKYAINIGNDISAIVIITETNSYYDIGDPNTDPYLEEVIILGISVVKTKDEWSPNRDTYYSFNSKGIYYVIEMHNLPDDESYKIIESIIMQLD